MTTFKDVEKEQRRLWNAFSPRAIKLSADERKTLEKHIKNISDVLYGNIDVIANIVSRQDWKSKSAVVQELRGQNKVLTAWLDTWSSLVA